MFEIRSIAVAQTRIFGIDEIPFELLQAPEASQRIRERFGFKPADTSFPFAEASALNALMFQNGVWTDSKSQPIAVSRLVIEPVRVLFTVHANSNAGRELWSELQSLLTEFEAPASRQPVHEVLLVEETTTVVKFPFQISALMSGSRIENFYRQLPNLIESHDAKMLLTPFTLKFRIQYSNLPEKLSSRGIQLNAKYLTIELRAQTSPDDMIYFISSPCSSSAHMTLLEDLEKTFGR